MDAYLSLVITGRNDNHAGDFLHRLSVFVDTLAQQTEQYELPVEIVLVEWNPVTDAPTLADAIDWPSSDYLEVRHVVVSEEIHDSYENADEMPIFQFIAKNVAIRYATGEYVLSTNPDCLLNDELFSHLAERPLDGDTFYRIDRHDVEHQVSMDSSVEERLAFCEENIYMIHSESGSYEVDRTVGDRLRDVVDTWVGLRAFPKQLYLLVARVWSYVSRNIKYPDQLILPRIHTNASGDFFLMSKENWERIRGYPELTTQWHGDSYICIQAAGLGLDQEIFEPPMKLYHQPHPGAHDDRPTTHWPDVVDYSHRVLREPGELELLNDENWGLADRELPSEVIA